MIIFRVLKIVFNFLLGIVLLVFLPAVYRQFVASASDFLFDFNWHPFAIGAVLGCGIEKLLDRYLPWFGTLEHEVTHALVGLPLGYIPVGMKVTNHRGGYCRQICIAGWFYPITHHVVVLAPYYLPTLTAIMGGFRPSTPPGWQPWYDVGIGATFGYHCVSTAREIYTNYRAMYENLTGSAEIETDFHMSGVVFSGLFIVVMTLAAHGWILALIVRGYPGFMEDLLQIWQASYALAESSLMKLIEVATN